MLKGMKHEAGEFPRTQQKPVADMSDDEFDAWMATLPPCPSIRHVDDPDDGDRAEALADLAAGRVYDHAVVSRWFLTFGKSDYKPFREWLAEQDG